MKIVLECPNCGIEGLEIFPRHKLVSKRRKNSTNSKCSSCAYTESFAASFKRIESNISNAVGSELKTLKLT